jgi:hypothetical protein
MMAPFWPFLKLEGWLTAGWFQVKLESRLLLAAFEGLHPHCQQVLEAAGHLEGAGVGRGFAEVVLESEGRVVGVEASDDGHVGSTGNVDGAGISHEDVVVLVGFPPKGVASGRSLEAPAGPGCIIVRLLTATCVFVVKVIARVAQLLKGEGGNCNSA